MSFLVRADNGYKWQTIRMDKLSFDSVAKVILVSEELADRLLQNRDLWRKIPPKPVKDELGFSHVCEHAIKISYRWGDETATRDAKIYVSSQLKQSPRMTGTGSMASVHLLVPSSLATPEVESASTVQPNYHLTPQSQGT